MKGCNSIPLIQRNLQQVVWLVGVTQVAEQDNWFDRLADDMRSEGPFFCAREAKYIDGAAVTDGKLRIDPKCASAGYQSR
jgi:hypothetical protein